MPWTRLDDTFYGNPKILDLNHEAFRLYVVSLNWSVAQLTDGHVHWVALALCLPDETPEQRQAAAEQLVKVGLWNVNGTGWVIHDFLEYQETRETIEDRRQRWADSKRKQRERSDLDSPPKREDMSARTPTGHVSQSPRLPSHPIPKVEPNGSTRKAPRPSEDPDQINRDGIWTALEDQFGKASTKTARTLRGKLVKSLHGAGATYTDVKDRAAAWPKLFPPRNGPQITLTDTALEKWWGPLGLIVETGKPPPPCPICDSRRIVGVTEEGEIVKADDPRAVGSDRCRCVTR